MDSGFPVMAAGRGGGRCLPGPLPDAVTGAVGRGRIAYGPASVVRSPQSAVRSSRSAARNPYRMKDG